MTDALRDPTRVTNHSRLGSPAANVEPGASAGRPVAVLSSSSSRRTSPDRSRPGPSAEADPASETPSAGHPPRPARILVVEDSQSDVRLLEKALRARGIAYNLTVYEDGEQAARSMSNDTTLAPDLILVDLNLPRRDGFEVLRSVLSIPRLSGIPVAVFTSSTAARDRNRSEILGVARYIPKPPTLDEFINEVGTAVEELLRSSASRAD